MFLYYKNKASGDIFEEKSISVPFCEDKEPTMIQLNRIQLTSQAPASVKVELLTASAFLEYASTETNKPHGYKIRFSSHL